MKIPTIQQYKKAIPDLPHWQLDALTELYRCPNSSATAKELVRKIHPSNPRVFVAMGRLGKAGKTIARSCGIRISKKGDSIKVVAEPYKKKTVGWTMHKKLQIAFKELFGKMQ